MEQKSNKDKLLQSQCRAILNCEDALKYIMDEQAKRIAYEVVKGENAFEYARKNILNEGILEGQKRLMSELYKLAK